MAGLATIICLTALVGGVWTHYEGDACRTKERGFGTCKNVNECPKALEQIRSGEDPNICSYSGRDVIVCCANSDAQQPELSRETKKTKSYKMCQQYGRDVTRQVQLPVLLIRKPLVDHVDCAMQTGTQLVVNGDRCLPQEFPHMVLLGFGTRDDISWKCGGTLISRRYVMTAGHCIFTRGSNVSFALLGDLNITSSADNEYVQQLAIVDIVPHPDYKYPSHYNDIALLKLEHDVDFTAGVRPACIHDMEVNAEQQLVATVTGWGMTHSASEGSDILLKADLRIVDTADCAPSYTQLARTRKLQRGIEGDSMICAGDPNGKKDSCQGDSGGPLQIQLADPYCMYAVIGVTSFGPTACAANGTPGVYTRVSHFRTWIESVVWPN